jgi:hypothetical protein
LVGDEIMPEAIANFHINEVSLTMEEIRKLLKEHETKYGMMSEEFYKLWRKGDGLDTKDTVEWAILYELSQNENTKLERL